MHLATNDGVTQQKKMIKKKDWWVLTYENGLFMFLLNKQTFDDDVKYFFYQIKQLSKCFFLNSNQNYDKC